MKTYKKGEYTAHETFAWNFDIMKESQKWRIQLSHVSLDFILDMGFEEVPEEPVQVPEWINEAYSYFQWDDRHCMWWPNGREAFVAAILKHYPKQEELSVEGVISAMKKSFHDIEAIDKGAEALRGDCLQPLDVDKVIEYLRSCCAIVTWTGIWVDPTPILSIDSVRLKNILSKYWIPKITKREIEDEASKRRTNREEWAEAVTDFLESKWLLDKSK